MDMKKNGSVTIGRAILDGAMYLLGSVLYACSVNIFTVPNQIAPGGATGVATILNYAFHLPVGVTILLLNLPLLIAAWCQLGRGFTLRTAVVTVLSSVVIHALAPFLPTFHGDMILTALFGGVLAGAGLGLVFMRGATTGGSEIVARLLEKRWRHIPIGRLILLVDALVVGVSALVFRQVESALYAVVLIFVSSRMMDALIYGGNGGQLFMILTNREDEVSRAILDRLERGVTFLKASGAYSGEEKRMLLCAVRRPEVYRLRMLVEELDPDAFLMMVPAEEVLGEGFRKGNSP